MAKYQSTAEPRSWTGDVPVYCTYDELVDTVALVGNPRNPNGHPDDQIDLLGSIIVSTGWRNNITVSRRSGFIVKGHGRLLAALRRGIPQCPVEYQEYASDAEEWADLTADNRLAELAETDEAKLAELLAEINQSEVPLDLTGYTDEDLDALLDELVGEDPEEAPVDTPMAQTLPPMTRPGDLWLLGGHRLLCGDATDEAAIERLMDGQKAHMVHTDPPYGVSYETQSGAFGKILNDDRTHDDLYAGLLLPVFRLYRKHTIEDAAFYVWHASSTRRDFEDALTAAGLMENQYIIWVKNGIALGHADYQWAHEPCFYASRAGVKPRFYGDRAQHTVWRAVTAEDDVLATTLGPGLVLTDGNGGTLCITDKAPKGKKLRYVRMNPELRPLTIIQPDQSSTVWEVSRETGTLHPTQKPVELPRRAIENSSQPGEIVLDFFGGSGSTLLAAEMTGRRCFSVELDPVYCDVAISRYVVQSHDTGAVCIRDGQRLSYLDLVRQWAIENGMAEEVAKLRYPVVVVKKIVPAGQQDAQGGDDA